jgi:uncharacterized membrane protein YccC
MARVLGNLARLGRLWRRAGVRVLRQDAPVWGCAVRTTIAAVLAFWVALRLDLTAPSRAALTVFIVAFPQAGAVLEKSLYRIIGGIIGALVAVGLVFAFAQLSDVFLLSVVLWVAVCVAASSWFRNAQVYAWLLAGYSACLIGFPAYQHPEQTFFITLDRLSVIVVGIVCSALVAVVWSPRPVNTAILPTLRAVFHEFAGSLATALKDPAQAADSAAVEKRFLHSFRRVESSLVFAAFEDPEARASAPVTEAFENWLMIASTSVWVVERLRLDLQRRGLRDVLAALSGVTDTLQKALRAGHHGSPATIEEAGECAGRLAAVAQRWHTLAAQARAQLPAGTPYQHFVELEGALTLVFQLLHDVTGFTRSFADHGNPSAIARAKRRARFRSLPDPVAASLDGLRAAIALLLVSSLWISSGWPEGGTVASMTAVFCSLFAGALVPGLTVRRMFIGYVLGTLSGALFYLFLLPRLDGFLLLAVCLVPFMLFCGYLKGRPETATVASGFSIMFFLLVTVSEHQVFDAQSMFNYSVAQFVGLSATAVVFMVGFPGGHRLRARRLERTLKAELRRTLTARRAHLRDRIEMKVRDLTLRLGRLRGIHAADRHRFLRNGVRFLEVGLAITALRAQRERTELHSWVPEIDAALEHAVQVMEARDAAQASVPLEAITGLRSRIEAAMGPSPVASQLIGFRTTVWLLYLAVAEHAAALGVQERPAMEASLAT